MWNEWPKKGNSGDTGIDIVAEERATGEFCGIQCKFYLPENTLSAPDLDSYFAALGNARFSSGITISTTDKWGTNAEKSLSIRDKPARTGICARRPEYSTTEREKGQRHGNHQPMNSLERSPRRLTTKVLASEGAFAPPCC